MRRALALLLVGCTGGGSLDEPEETPSPAATEQVSFETLDGLTIRGTFTPAFEEGPRPAVLLLHQWQRDREDFVQIGPELRAAGLATLAIDLRSHGASDPSTLANPNELLTDPAEFPRDVQAALAFLADRPRDVDPDRLGVLGLSVGGNLAVVASNETWNGPPVWGALAIGAVSARFDRSQDLAADDNLTLRNGLYACGADEFPQADEAQQLHDATEGARELVLRPGTSAHGVELIGEDTALREVLVRWFADGL
jgi:dienelactone hydrolase